MYFCKPLVKRCVKQSLCNSLCTKELMCKVKKSNKIDTRTKNRALAEYQKTGNLSAVTKKYNVSRPTFYSWLKELSEFKPSTPETTNAVVTAIQATSKAAVRSIEQAAATRQEFLQQHYEQVGQLFSALVCKMTATINDEKSHPTLRDQAAAFTALTNFIKEFTPTEEQGNVSINLLQQTVNKS